MEVDGEPAPRSPGRAASWSITPADRRRRRGRRSRRSCTTRPPRAARRGDRPVRRRAGRPTAARRSSSASPAGRQTFFPANDHPSDKATYTFRITAPSDQVAVANGAARRARPQERRHHDLDVRGRASRWPPTSCRWRSGTSSSSTAARSTACRSATRSTASFTTRPRTPSPAPARCSTSSTTSGARTRSRPTGCWPCDEPLGFALETQTLTLIGSDIATEGRAADVILVHELAHQWVGDAVSPATWKDIWLNEGFATYSEWLWTERTGGPSRRHDRPPHRRARGSTPRRATPAATSCSAAPSTSAARSRCRPCARRSATTPSSSVLRTWVDAHRGGAATTADFIDLAEAGVRRPRARRPLPALALRRAA